MLHENTIVTKIEANPLLTSKKDELRQLNVAAYCRVSTDSDDQLQSYDAQVSYYSDFICKNPKWHFVGIYADEGITGTVAKKRDGFMSMIKDCEKGKIDLILTKSVSRFARNTVDSISYVRKLKAMDIGVFFEEQNLDTLKTDSEMFLGLYSVMAQAESENISANVRWGIQQRMKKGLYTSNFTIYGYTKGRDGKPEIVPDEARVVKRIYDMYIEGASTNIIANTLNSEGIKGKTGKGKWDKSSIRTILMNEKYTGDLILQKTYCVDCIGKKTKVNNGELPKYLVTNNHPAIIDKEVFNIAQMERARRGAQRRKSSDAVTELGKYSGKYALSQLLICGECGSYYRRYTQCYESGKKIYWRCLNRKENGFKKCKSKGIREDILHNAICEGLNMLMPKKDTIIDSIVATLDYGVGDSKDLQNKYNLETMIGEYQKKVDKLMNDAIEAQDGKEKFFEEIDIVYSKIKILREQVSLIEMKEKSKPNKENEIKRIIDSLKEITADFSEYNDVIARRVIDCIRVMKDNTITIYIKGGKEVNVPLKK